MKNNNTIEMVVKDELCTGCGTCTSFCPENAIVMVINQRKGIYIPIIDKIKCNKCGLCFIVCPGHSVDFKQLNTAIFGKQPEDNLLGNHLNCYTGYASDHDIRYNGSSGGIVTALLIFALEQGIIDGALVTRMNNDRPLEPEPFIARSREEIIAAAKSKYCPVPANIALREILKTKEAEKFAVVGLPCHIHGCRKAEELNIKLKQKIVLHLGIFCSNTDSFKGTEYILRKYGIKKETITQLNYRGFGWPGYMSIVFKNGEKRQIDYNEYMSLLHAGFFTPWRCDFCYDHFAELADISCGDAWLPEIVSHDKNGTSVIISRNITGQALLEKALSTKAIMITNLKSDRIRGNAAKKLHYSARSRIALYLNKKIPQYSIEQFPVTFFTCYSTLGMIARQVLSNRYLQWLISPYLKIMKSIHYIGKKIRKLVLFYF
jgi:coenzyme F420 hydrogenase subunit beta